MAWGVTAVQGLYQSMQDQGLPAPVAGQAAVGAQPIFTGSQTGLAVAAAGATNSTIFNCGSAVRSFKALVLLTASAGTSTINIQLQVSSSATFASDVVTVDSQFINANVAAQIYSLTFTGYAYDTARQFVRVNFVTGAGTSATADIGVLAV